MKFCIFDASRYDHFFLTEIKILVERNTITPGNEETKSFFKFKLNNFHKPKICRLKLNNLVFCWLC
jgi:hypothetical protein